jgi:MFS transporter, DHA1 family, tetracycline resistance protein
MFRSPLLPIFLTVFVDVLGLTIVLPLLPFYAEHFGASPIVVGTLAASYAVCQLVSGPILGRISDRVGRKPVLLVSQLGTFVAFLMLGFANTLAVLFVARVIDGLTAGNLSIAQAYISDVTTPENRTRSFALIGIAFGTGFLLGPAISGLLSHRFGYGAPAFAAATLSFMSIVFTITLLPSQPRKPEPMLPDAAPTPGAAAPASATGESAPPPSAVPGSVPSSAVLAASVPADTTAMLPTRAASAQAAPPPPPGGQRSLDFGRFFSRPEPRRRLLQFFSFALAFSTSIGGLALFLERRYGYNIRDVGLVFAFSGLIGAIVQGGLIGHIVKKTGEERLALVGFGAMAISYALLGFTHSRSALLTLIALGGFGIGVTRPSLTTLITKSVGRKEQGAALGASQSLNSVAQIFGPLMAGFLIEHKMLEVYGLTAASFAVLGVLLSRRTFQSEAPA